jgi:hypothetical protein
VGNIVGQEFERHEAVELGVLRFVNYTHATAAQPLDDAIVRDGLTDHQNVLGFRVASSYGRGIRESTHDGSMREPIEPQV